VNQVAVAPDGECVRTTALWKMRLLDGTADATMGDGVAYDRET
jgi:hypothetical protein